MKLIADNAVVTVKAAETRLENVTSVGKDMSSTAMECHVLVKLLAIVPSHTVQWTVNKSALVLDTLMIDSLRHSDRTK